MQIKQRAINASAANTFIAEGTAPLLARLFASRGVTQLKALSTNLANILPPNTLTNNQAMAKLLADAIAANKKLLVIGDFLWT